MPTSILRGTSPPCCKDGPRFLIQINDLGETPGPFAFDLSPGPLPAAGVAFVGGRGFPNAALRILARSAPRGTHEIVYLTWGPLL